MSNATIQSVSQSALRAVTSELTTKSTMTSSKALIEKYSQALKLEVVDSKVEAMVESVGMWWEGLKAFKSPSWLTLIGSNGVGKTHCATKILEWHKAKYSSLWGNVEYPAVVVHWPSVIEDLRPTAPNHKQTASYVKSMRYWPLLVLDEVGAEHDATGWATDKLATLLGCRDGRWTVITTNLTKEKLSNLDRRIVSRMVRHGGRMVEVVTKDYYLR